MTESPWLAFSIGAAVTAASVAAFLYALRLGLTRGLWWPLGVVVSLWLIVMAAYSAWDSRAEGHGSRRRIAAVQNSGSAAPPAPMARFRSVEIAASPRGP